MIEYRASFKSFSSDLFLALFSKKIYEFWKYYKMIKWIIKIVNL